MGARRTPVNSKAWLNECQEILENTKGQVRLYLGEEPPDIKNYAQAYKKDLLRPWKISSWDKLFVCMQQVQVIFGGDFHPFAQAQRTHLRLLRKIIHDRSVILAVECLSAADQPILDQFLKGDISEESFLEKVQWERKWGFPWAHYKPLFDFAIKNGMSVVGLNTDLDELSGAGLTHRDQRAAEKLKQIINNHPEDLVYVLYGDLHIAQDHLPSELSKLVSPQIETASFYLNSEKIYFELAEKSQENSVEVVEFNDREFCLLSSPPWVKWHSYLMYLEENFDVDLDWDDEEDEDDDGMWEFRMDHTDHVSGLVRMIAAAMNEEVKSDDIEVYSLNDPQALVSVEKSLSAVDYAIAHTLVRNDRSFYIPSQGFFYLSKSTVNHAATLAGQYIHAKISNRKSMLWNFPEDFKKVIWVEAMSFLLSKFVNPKRKSQSMADLKKQLEAFDKEDHGREPLLLALDQKMIELLAMYSDTPAKQTYAPREKSSYILAARFIGEILGDRYFVLYQKQILGIDNIRAFLQKSLDEPHFNEFYLAQLKSLDALEMEGKTE